MIENSHLCVDNDANVFGDVSHVSDSHPSLGRVSRVLVPESQHCIRLGEVTIHEAGLQSENSDKNQCKLIIDIPIFLQFAYFRRKTVIRIQKRNRKLSRR